jgi:hypothetical protein
LARGAADIQALAAALDFTKIQILPSGSVTNAALVAAYPMGVSIMSLGGADAAAGGWPSAGTLTVITTKPSGNAAQQIAFRMSTDMRAWARILGGSNSLWQLITPWVFVTAPLADIAAGASLSVTVTFPANTFTGAPGVSVTPVGSAFLTAGAAGTVATTGFTAFIRNNGAGTIAGTRVNVVANGSY